MSYLSLFCSRALGGREGISQHVSLADMSLPWITNGGHGLCTDVVMNASVTSRYVCLTHFYVVVFLWGLTGGGGCLLSFSINDRDQLFYVYCEREQVLTHSIQCTPPKTECGCPKTVTYATPPMEERRNKERRRKKNLCDTAIIVNSLF